MRKTCLNLVSDMSFLSVQFEVTLPRPEWVKTKDSLSGKGHVKKCYIVSGRCQILLGRCQMVLRSCPEGVRWCPEGVRWCREGVRWRQEGVR